MRNQHIVRDIADRSGTLFSRAESRASTPVVVNLRESVFPRKSRQLKPVTSASGNVAELKIYVDGLPVVLVFPFEGVLKKPPGVDPGRIDINSLVSSALEKIVDRLSGSRRRTAATPSNPPPNVLEMDPETIAVPSVQETVLRVGPLELNLLNRTAKRGDRAIELRPREFRLLRYMMERSDKLLTRANLLKEVWNYNFVPKTNLVDVHMGRLRRKIDDPNEPAMIRSVRGAGFVLSANPLSQN